MQGGTQARVFCPRMCNARDRWVGFCLIYPRRRRQLKQPRKQPAVVSSCHKGLSQILENPNVNLQCQHQSTHGNADVEAKTKGMNL